MMTAEPTPRMSPEALFPSMSATSVRSRRGSALVAGEGATLTSEMLPYRTGIFGRGVFAHAHQDRPQPVQRRLSLRRGRRDAVHGSRAPAPAGSPRSEPSSGPP